MIGGIERLERIKARAGSLSPSHQSKLYGAIARLVLEDIPWLIETLEDIYASGDGNESKICRKSESHDGRDYKSEVGGRSPSKSTPAP